MLRKIGITMVAGTILFTGGVPAAAEFQPSVETLILVDADTGQILFEQNVENPLPPASMTKMMSEYLILEAVNNGDIAWDDEIEVNEFLAGLSHNQSLSNVMMRIEDQYTVEELYESVAIYSANASTMALAAHIAGSEGEFVELMNERGEELGMGELLREAGAEYGMEELVEISEAGHGDFQFVNSTGLPNRLLEGNQPEGTGPEEDNYMSAKATATLAYHLVNDYPEVLDTASIPAKTFREGTSDEIHMQNWNWMLEGTQYSDLDYEYADGLKTGFTEAAGYTFTGTAERDGQRLISVVMGADSEPHRFQETESVMEWGFENFEEVEIFPENMTLSSQETLPVAKGEEEEVSIASTDGVTQLVMDGEEEDYTYSIELDEELLTEDGKLEAPVEEGTVVGQMVVEYEGDREVSYLEGEEAGNSRVDIVTTGSVERAGWISLTMNNVGSFFSGVWSNVSNTVKGWF
ncbi:D-alanyl-D-alanine carboxypeptidase family protein [Alkalicoccus daliensis]|uniref:serine-type D-Ala-D-Ala carboxypeptidase n=1 Tax=Alkalicoccus daliensis TaxID=745820 RepID=A0A1H0KYB4_9BACI|nr:D-alanyl-D-alanine carboxypeptidase family protein [Alkalicoccus daliensis]SDO60939.1 D-Ala-D-Ala carboxypeptidase A. Serine peptidase. MEROPS family S11 [Alkalicoccus daliensis]